MSKSVGCKDYIISGFYIIKLYDFYICSSSTLEVTDCLKLTIVVIIYYFKANESVPYKETALSPKFNSTFSIREVTIFI